MALVSSKSNRIDSDIGQQIKKLLAQRYAVQSQEKMLAEIRESVKQYEVRYGMSSDCIHDAIEAGELVEDLDVGHWIFQYELLRSVEEK